MKESNLQNFNSYVISVEDAILLDKKAIEINKIPPLVLMEEASERIFSRLKIDFSLPDEKIAIICGWGNNAGDALSLARKFYFSNFNFDIFYFPEKQGSELYQIQLEIIKTLNINLFDIKELENKIFNYTLIIDAIFGIGYKYREDKEIEKIFSLINSSKATIVAIDVPSGLNREKKESIRADFTYSIGFMKELFFTPNTRSKVGSLKDIKISFNLENIEYKKNVIYFSDNIPKLERKKEIFVHKYKRGACICIGGSVGKLGSIIYSGKAAMSAGSGIVLVLSETNCVPLLNSLSKSLIFDSIENYNKYIDKYDTILIGPGLDFSNENTKNVIFEILKFDKQFIFDASFFTLFDSSVFSFLKREPVLTPHTNELKNFFKRDDFIKNTIEVIQEISIRQNCYLLYKDTFMLFSTPENVTYVLDNPNRLVAQAGSGDILAGIITGTIAQGYNIVDSVLESVRIFYSIGNILNKKGKISYNPNDFISLINEQI